jgi:DNA-binding PadR family transcriptional regulator
LVGRENGKFCNLYREISRLNTNPVTRTGLFLKLESMIQEDLIFKFQKKKRLNLYRITDNGRINLKIKKEDLRREKKMSEDAFFKWLYRALSLIREDDDERGNN